MLINRRKCVWIHVLLCSIALSGCANAIPSVPELMARSKWVGKPVSLAFKKWGGPAERKSTDDGQTQYIWHYRNQYPVRVLTGVNTRQVGEGLISTMNIYEDQLRTDACDFYLTADKQGVITAFSTLQNRVTGCREFYWGSNRP